VGDGVMDDEERGREREREKERLGENNE